MVISPKLMFFILKGLFSDTQVYWNFEEQNIFGEIKTVWKKPLKKTKTKTETKQSKTKNKTNIQQIIKHTFLTNGLA